MRRWCGEVFVFPWRCHLAQTRTRTQTRSCACQSFRLEARSEYGYSHQGSKFDPRSAVTWSAAVSYRPQYFLWQSLLHSGLFSSGEIIAELLIPTETIYEPNWTSILTVKTKITMALLFANTKECWVTHAHMKILESLLAPIFYLEGQFADLAREKHFR